MRPLLPFALFSSFTILACSSSSGGGGAAPCSDAGTCGDGLTCISGFCILPPDAGLGGSAGSSSGGIGGVAGSTPSGGAGGASGAGATGGTGGAAGEGATGGTSGSGGQSPLCAGSATNGGIATAGVNCQAAGSVACAGSAQASVLACDEASCKWSAGTPCASGKLCDTTDGSCKAKITGCTAGGAVCIAGVRYTCGPDLVSTTPAPCPAGAPICTGAGVCAGCTSVGDCPTPSNPCQNATCNAGTCGTTLKPAGSGCGSSKICSASGSCNCVAGYQDCDGSPSSCEAYPANDPANCGTCGNSCQGGTCSNGTCSATPIVTSSDLCEPIATDGSYVYYAENSASAIRRVPVSGGSSTYLSASGGTVRGLAVDSSYVYWANLNDLWRAPKAGGSGSILSNLADGSEIVVTTYDVYFADVIGGNIWSVPKTGGSPTLVASGQVQYSGASLAMVFSDMAGDNGNVVWSLDGNGFGSGVVRRGSPFGGGFTTLSGGSRPMAVALDGTSAYFADGGSGVYVTPISGSSVSPLATWGTVRYVSDIVVTSTQAYISSANSGFTQTVIERVSKLGGSLQVVAQQPGSPGQMAADSQSIYFLAGSAIYRISK